MESGGLASIFLGVTSAANFGISDFLGGLTSRRIKTVSVLITSQFVVMITLLLLTLVTSDRVPSWLEGILAFVAGCLSIAVGNLFYYAMAHGKMSIVAPVATVVSACLPVGYSTLRQGAPGALTLVGYAVAFVSVFLVSSTERIGVIEWRALRLPVLAGVIAGVMFILIGYTTEQSTYTPLLIMRTTSFLGNLLIAFRIGAPRIVPLAHLPAVLMTGLTSAGAIICFVLAAQAGRLDIATVLSALAPAVTVGLAAVFLREHINRVQAIGIALATGAIVLISF